MLDPRILTAPLRHPHHNLPSLTHPLRTLTRRPSQSRPLFTTRSRIPGPTAHRIPNRPLPSLSSVTARPLLRTLPLFLLTVTGSAWAIFNYQKSSSSVISSVLYALRTNDTARRVLGDGIYFASRIPWIRGELNQLHGRVDVRFWVQGSKGVGEVRFVSRRERRGENLRTQVWELRMKDSQQVLDLLSEDEPLEKVIEKGLALELEDGRIIVPGT